MTSRPPETVPQGARRGFIGQSATSSVAALVAMLTGLLLDVSVSVHFGAGRQSDAFFAASRIPIGVAALLMTVAVQAWVPQFVRDRRDHGSASLTAFASRMFTAVMLLGLVIWGVASLVRPAADGTHRARPDAPRSSTWPRRWCRRSSSWCRWWPARRRSAAR